MIQQEVQKLMGRLDEVQKLVGHLNEVQELKGHLDEVLELTRQLDEVLGQTRQLDGMQKLKESLVLADESLTLIKTGAHQRSQVYKLSGHD